MIVTNASRTLSAKFPKISTLSELVSRVRDEFGIPAEVPIDLALEEDGTVIDDDDYLDYLPDDAEVVFLPPWEKYNTWEQRLQSVLNSQPSQEEFLRSARKFFTSDVDSKSSVVEHYVSNLKRNRHHSKREDDPSWFEGTAPRFKSKEQVMRERARSRMRNYLRDSKVFLLAGEASSSAKELALVKRIAANFEEELKRRDFHGHYFDRSEEEVKFRYCDEEGSFRCQGTFSRTACDYQDHEINPYDNRESLIVFQNWNLDHGVEKSRTVLPGLRDAIRTAVRSPKTGERLKVNDLYFFELLFTSANLKLVHTVCHVKTGHKERRLDPDRVFLSGVKKRRRCRTSC